ncbi:helix-turn-helix transcriptional regulator [Streptomyces sp. NBC_01565]|uniref:helix-turn-helix transcriptional regulator n=1 Tax=unclassified Streptomyces TaxID=2593676 RepID=UPI00225A895F|nr:helix-turn-helix transcriptional regulator [Streptomyces sp. NBC_01565]MCX4539425.1 helix-turn-helix transcriptional regulator [Streptomyces sp. NBC_01565]
MNFAFDKAVLTQDLAAPEDLRQVSSQANLPATTALLAQHTGDVSGVVIRMTPMGAYRLFGVPMAQWEAPDLNPGHLLPRVLRFLPEQLREAAPHLRRGLLDRTLTPLLESGPFTSPEVSWAWRELHRTRGQIRAAQLAAGALWSVRHLERQFRQQVGRSPAAIARILRFTHAVRLRDAGLPLARVAQLAGYHDQAHFTRVFRATTGLTPTQLPVDRLDWSSALLPLLAPSASV